MGDGPKLVGLLTLTKCESVLDNITIIFIAFDDNFFYVIWVNYCLKNDQTILAKIHKYFLNYF